MSIVQLRYATLPFIGFIARHYWFVVFDESGECHRWEVWQRSNAGGVSVGHLHCDLKPPDAGVGGGPMHIAAEWKGDEARRLRKVLESSSYPHCHRYRMWPGPNSNTFVAWVLRKAGVEHNLGAKALGKRYPVA